MLHLVWASKAFPTSTWSPAQQVWAPRSLGTKECSSTSQILGFLKGTKLPFQARLRTLSRDPF